MVLSVKEVVKYYSATINSPSIINGSKLYPVKARIVKLVGENDHYWYEVCSHYKKSKQEEPYTTSIGGHSIESAERSLIKYLEEFQQALLDGGEVVPNPYY